MAHAVDIEALARELVSRGNQALIDAMLAAGDELDDVQLWRDRREQLGAALQRYWSDSGKQRRVPRLGDAVAGTEGVGR